MPHPPLPPNEHERLASLRRYALLDTPPEESFDRLTALASRLFDVPLALITLVDEERQWFKSREGPACSLVQATEMPRHDAFCAYTILSSQALVVEDARLDARFADNPLVTGDMGIRFYAGAPLLDEEGRALGALCLIDFRPRVFTARQQDCLQDLAASVMSELKLRAVSRELEQRVRFARSVFEDLPLPQWVCAAETLRFLDVNPAALTFYGYTREQFLAMTLRDLSVGDLSVGGFADEASGLHRLRSGARRRMELTSHPTDYNGTKALLFVARDVTRQRETEDALRRSEERLRLTLSSLPIILWSVDKRGIFTCSEGLDLTPLGLEPGELVGTSAFALYPDQIETHQNLRNALAGQSVCWTVTLYGNIYQSHAAPLRDARGAVTGLIGISYDMTAQRQAEESCRSLFEHAVSGIFRTLPDGRALAINPAAARMLGHASTDAALAYYRDVNHGLYVQPGCRAEFTRQVEQHGSVVGFEAEVYRLDGTIITLSIDAHAVRDAEEKLLWYEGFLTERTHEKALEREHDALLSQTEALLAEALDRADHDPLTGLLNHRAFHNRLDEDVEAAQRRGQPLALLMLDLDGFTFFNDVYGHVAGDEVLRRVGQALQAVCRTEDTLARWAGDQFALLLPGFTAAEAAGLAEEVREAVRRAGHTPPGYETSLPLNVSLGIAALPGDGPGRAGLLEAADTRLRFAKSGGEAEGEALKLRRHMTRSVGGFSMLDALVTAVDAKDRYTRKHSEDVMRHCTQIAVALELNLQVQHDLEVAALLHDVGKIGVPDAILRKPGTLTAEDREAVRQHPLMGAIMVGAVPGFEETLDAVRHHHERWDGEGYPFGLRGLEIPLSARIMAVADAYSAMTTDRPYRQSLGAAQARHILAEGAGTQWDPACVEAFLSAGQ